jgi:predicted hydrocarbon binding protein
MQLLLTYFDDLLGPTLFYSYPENDNKESNQLTNALMDLRIKENFFELMVQGKKYYNLSFSIPSTRSRGRQRSILISAILERQLESIMAENILKDMAQKFLGKPNIERGFFYSNQKDSEIKVAYEEIMTIIKTGYEIFKKKSEQIAFIDTLFEQNTLNPESNTGNIVRTMATAFITTIDARTPDGAKLLFEVGTILGGKFEILFTAEDSNDLIEQLGYFWKKHGFGVIDEIKNEEQKILFNVYDCFECQHMPNIGQTVCRFDEGFLSKISELKLQNKFTVKEIECYATGKDHCRFELKPLV